MVNTAGLTDLGHRPAGRAARTAGLRPAGARPRTALRAASAGSAQGRAQGRRPVTCDQAGVTLRPARPPSPAVRTAIDAVRACAAAAMTARAEQSPTPPDTSGRRKPSDWAACTARSGSPVSPTVRDQISRPIAVPLGAGTALRRPTARHGHGIRRPRRRPRPHRVRAGSPGARPPAAARRQQPGPRRPGDRGGHGRPCRPASSTRLEQFTGGDGDVQRDVEPVSYGFASRAVRIASTSKDGRPAEDGERAAARLEPDGGGAVVVDQPGEEGGEIRRLPRVGEVQRPSCDGRTASSPATAPVRRRRPGTRSEERRRLLRGDPARPLRGEVVGHDDGRGPRRTPASPSLISYAMVSEAALIFVTHVSMVTGSCRWTSGRL